MPVYVDRAAHPYRGMVMCHMLADTVAELHEFAAKLGMRREWFQPLSSPHYDLSKGVRARALLLGAIEIDRRGVADLIQRRRAAWLEEMHEPRRR